MPIGQVDFNLALDAGQHQCGAQEDAARAMPARVDDVAFIEYRCGGLHRRFAAAIVAETEAHPGRAALGEPPAAVHVQRGTARAAVDLATYRRQAEERQPHPFAPAEHDRLAWSRRT